MSKTILLKIHDAQATQATHVIQAGSKHPLVLKTQGKTNYQLIEEESGLAPDRVVTQRVGDDLHVSFEGSTEPDLILQDYYPNPESPLIGQDLSGIYYHYVAETGAHNLMLPTLSDGAVSGLVLGATQIAPALTAPLYGAAALGAAAAFPALGALALGAAGLIAATHGGDSKSNGATPADTTAPAKPGLAISADGTTASGSAEPGSTVIIKDAAGKQIGSVTAGADGKYSVALEPALTNGETITATAKDAAGNESAPANATAPDTTAPAAPTDTAVSADGRTVTGKAEPGSTVTIKDQDGNPIGTATADENGNYTATLNPALTNGEKLSATATDAAGNTSDPTSATAPDTTAPATPTDTAVSPDGKTVTGKAEPGSTVTIKDQDGNPIGTATAGADGSYSVTLSPALTNGEKLTATATDAAGNTSIPASATAPDTTAPAKPGLAISADGATASGSAEPGSAVTIKDAAGNTVGTATADTDGKYSATLSPALTNGETLTATAKDAAGNESAPATATAPDLTVPAAPTDTLVSADGSAVTGKAEPGSTVTIKDAAGNVLGTAKADADGNYTVPLSTPQTNGQQLTATAQDAAGNTSAPATATAPDTTAPAKPGLAVSGDGSAITGTAEPGSTVTVKDKDGNVVGTATAGTDGTYTITPATPLTNGEELTATAKDAAGNESAPATATAPDTTAPAAPTDTAVSADGRTVTGKAEPGATVTVKDEKGNVIGTATADENGQYSVPLTNPQTNGQTVTATAQDAAGNTSPEASATAPDTTAPDKPTATVAADGTSVTGKAEPGSTVTIKDAAGKEIGTATADENGNYTATLSPALTNGEKLSATATDAAGNPSQPTPATAPDTTAPAAPDARISQNGATVSGTTEPGATVAVKDEKGNVIGTATADEKGQYSVPLTNPQTNGQSVTVTAADKVGNTSPATTLTAPDTTAPDMPIASVGADDKTVTGTAEPGSKVTVADKNGQTHTTTAGADGAFTLELPTPQTTGETLKVTATDAAGNESLPSELATRDTTPPATPTGTINTEGSAVTGTAEPGSLVTIKDATGNVLGTATADADGNYTVQLSTPQTNGQQLAAMAEDAAGNESPKADISAPDTTAPAQPSAQVSGDGTTVTGAAEPGSTVTIKDAAGNVLGTATADPDGKYTVPLSTPQTNGQQLTATAQDAAGNTSAPANATAPDTTAPATPTGTTVSADGTSVTGKAEPGSTVTIKDAAGNVLGTAKADADGNYTVPLSTPQTNGQQLTATAQDAAGNTSAPATATAPDTTAPAKPGLAVSGDGSAITGTAEPGSTVTVKDKDGNVVGTATAGTDGTYTITPATPLTNGEELTATAKDAAGNESAPATATAPDTTAPAAPTDTAVSADGRTVTGKAEPGSTVTIKDQDGNPIGTATADENGNYSVPLSNPQTNGQTVTATAQDAAGNTSPEASATAPDTTAPDKPTATVAADGTTVTGEAEPGSTVIIKDAAGKEIGTATADENGNYTATLNPALTNGEKLSATATDAAGNPSQPTPATAPDTTAPAAPAAFINEDGTSVTGTAEPGSTVTVKDKDGKVIGTATADENGTYSAKLSAPQTDGSKLAVTAADATGNTSDPASVQAPDTTPPANPTEAPAVLDNVGIGGVMLPAGSEETLANNSATNDNTPTVVVPKALADAAAAEGNTLQLVVDGKPVPAVLGTDAAGNTTLTPATPLDDGPHTISYLLQDAAGNQSQPAPATSITVNTQPPATTRPGSYADDVGAVQSPASTADTTDDTTPGLNVGKLPAGTTPTLYVDGKPVAATASLDANGNTTLTPVTPLGEGTHNLAYALTDAVGNVSVPSPALTLTVDTQSPATPASAPSGYVDDVAPVISTVASPSASGTDTNDTTPGLIIGSLPTGTTPALYVDGVKVEAIYDAATGTLTPVTPLAEGEHQLTYTLTDAAGNESGQSPALTLTVDTQPPATPAAPGSYADNEGAVQSPASTAAATDDTTPGLNIGSLPTGTTPVLYVNGQKVEATYDATTGTLTPKVPLEDGKTYALTYTLTDTAGNESGQSPALTLTVDTQSPATPASAPSGYVDDVAPVISTVASPSASGTDTNDTTPGLIIGSLPTGTTPALYVDGVKVEAIYDAATGTLTPVTPLAEGEHQLTYTLTDAAGNESGQSPALTLTVDTQPPATPAAPGSYADNEGAVQSPASTAAATDDTTPGLNIGSLPTGTTPVLYVNGQKVEATYDATTGTLTPKVPLEDGKTYALTYTLTETAGNESGQSDPLTLTVDATPPTAATIGAANQQGVQINLPADAATGDTVKVDYTDASGAKQTVTLTKQADGSWASSAPAVIAPVAAGAPQTATLPANDLKNGEVVTATTADAAGNTATPVSKVVALDTPTAATIDQANADGVKIGLPADAEAGDKVTVKVGGQEATLTKQADGSWTSDNTTLVPTVAAGSNTASIDKANAPDGTVVTATSVDAAGNPADPATATVDALPPTSATITQANADGVKVGLPTDAKVGDKVEIDVDGKKVTVTKGESGWSVPSGSDPAITLDGDTASIDKANAPDGTVVTATSVDAAGNPAAPATATVDALAPTAATIDQANADGVKIGLPADAEAGDKVTVKVGGQEATLTKQADGSWTSDNTTLVPTVAAGSNSASIDNANAPDGTVITATSIDAASNPAAPATATVDAKAPTLEITDNVTADVATGEVTFTFTFSEAVQGFDASDITVANGTEVAGSFTKVSDSVYTLKVTPNADTQGVNVTATVTGATAGVTDMAGNAYAGTDLGAQAIDTKKPTVTVTLTESNGETDNAGTLIKGETATVTFQFSEEVKDFSAANVTVMGGTLTNLMQDATDKTRWTAVLTPNTDAQLADQKISVDANYTDLAGNPGTAGESAPYAIDTQPPTVAITQVNGAAFTGTSSGATGVSISYEKDGVTTTVPSGEVTFNSDGTWSTTAKIPDGASVTVTATDDAGNTATDMRTSVDTEAPKFTDGLVPSATLIQISAEDNIAVQEVIFTLTPATQTDKDKLMVMPGAKDNGDGTVTVPVPGTDGVYKLENIAPADGSTVTAVATDAAGNATTVVSSSADSTAPVFASLQANASTISGKVTDNIGVESVVLTFTPADPANLPAGATETTPGSGIYTVQVTPNTDGTFSLPVAVKDGSAVTAVAKDAAGNSTQANVNNVDANVPTVTVVAFLNEPAAGYKAGDTVQVKLTLSEAVTFSADASGSTITLDLGGGQTTTAILTQGAAGGNELVFTATIPAALVNHNAANVKVTASTLTLPTGVTATDPAGNALNLNHEEATGKLLDTTAPSAPGMDAVTFNAAALSDGASQNLTVKLPSTEDADKKAQAGDTVTVKVGDVTLTKVLTAAEAAAGTVNLPVSDAQLATLGEGTHTVTLTLQDAVGNATTASSSLTIDKTATIDITSIAGQTQATEGTDGYATLNSRGNVEIKGTTTGVEPGQVVTVTVGDKTATATVGTDGSWTATITGGDWIKNGSTYSFKASVADQAGNPAFDTDVTAATVLGNTAPTLTAPATPLAGSEDTLVDVTGISVNDADAGETLTVTVTANHGGKLSLGAGAGLLDTNAADGVLTLTGTQDQVNTALATLQYQPAANVNGQVTLTVTATDSNVVEGANGALPAEAKTITLNLAAVNDAPTLNSVDFSTAHATEATNASGASALVGTVNGNLNVLDVDAGDTVSAQVVDDAAAVWSKGALPDEVDLSALIAASTLSFTPATNGAGTLGVNGTAVDVGFAWTPPADTNLDWLNKDDTLTLTWKVQATDGNNAASEAKDLQVVITGTNDAPDWTVTTISSGVLAPPVSLAVNNLLSDGSSFSGWTKMPNNKVSTVGNFTVAANPLPSNLGDALRVEGEYSGNLTPDNVIAISGETVHIDAGETYSFGYNLERRWEGNNPVEFQFVLLKADNTIAQKLGVPHYVGNTSQEVNANKAGQYYFSEGFTPASGFTSGDYRLGLVWKTLGAPGSQHADASFDQIHLLKPRVTDPLSLGDLLGVKDGDFSQLATDKDANASIKGFVVTAGKTPDDTSGAHWEFNNGGTWTSLADTSEANGIFVPKDAQLRYVHSINGTGNVSALKLVLADDTSTLIAGDTVNLGTAGTGEQTPYSANTLSIQAPGYATSNQVINGGRLMTSEWTNNGVAKVTLNTGENSDLHGGLFGAAGKTNEGGSLQITTDFNDLSAYGTGHGTWREVAVATRNESLTLNQGDVYSLAFDAKQFAGTNLHVTNLQWVLKDADGNETPISPWYATESTRTGTDLATAKPGALRFGETWESFELAYTHEGASGNYQLALKLAVDSGGIYNGDLRVDRIFFGQQTMTGPSNGIGNDVLSGTAANDRISGGAGNDRIDGGAGLNYLIGGTGADTFVFQTDPVQTVSDGQGGTKTLLTVDTIADFSNAEGDKLALSQLVFTGLTGAAGSALAADQLVLGTTANAAQAQVLYDQGTGKLFYDADGTGAGEAVHFATLANKPNDLTVNSFMLI
ncbi:MAG: Ig-like domain-containing protein [Pseudomonadota bacterium]|nr:Ig-like domain-containing protein [Pseudomonadota bacterium]